MDKPSEIKETPPGRDSCVLMLGCNDHRKPPMRATFRDSSRFFNTQRHTEDSSDDSLSSRLLPS